MSVSLGACLMASNHCKVKIRSFLARESYVVKAGHEFSLDPKIKVLIDYVCAPVGPVHVLCANTRGGNPALQGQSIRVQTPVRHDIPLSAINSGPAIGGGYCHTLIIHKDKRHGELDSQTNDGTVRYKELGRLEWITDQTVAPTSRVEVEMLFKSELEPRLGVVMDNTEMTSTWQPGI